MTKETHSGKDLKEDEIKTEDSFSSASLQQPVSDDPKETDDPKQLKEQLAQAEDKYLRAAAEFENFRKRTSKQFEDVVHAAEVRIFNDALEIVDNFKRALENPDNQKDFEAFKKGMALIYEQMKSFLKKHEIERIESVGNEFDPDLHEAVMQIETEEHPEGVIAEEMTAGFKKGEKVIRHSKVGVSTGKSKK